MSLGLVSGVGERWAAVEIACCWEIYHVWRFLLGGSNPKICDDH